MMADTSCSVFARDLSLDPDRLHRFVVGEDPGPRPMSAAEVEKELGDPFATLVLLRGTFPRTAEDTLTAIRDAVGDGNPLRDLMSFVLGEGSQIAFSDKTASLSRGLRFVVTLGATAGGPPDGPDVLLSEFHPRGTNVELMAWDLKAGGFNYYRAVGNPPAWVFAGNSRHALSDPTQGKGPFESHRSGALLMKELKRPWLNWDSPDVHIFGTAFAADDDRSQHAWFKNKEPGGAYAFEFEVARPAMMRWAKTRFNTLLANGGVVDRPARILQQLVDTSTVNLVSSKRESATAAASSALLALPPTLFVDADAFAEVGLEGPPQFGVVGNLYATSLKTFDCRLEDGQEFVQEGETHFAFVIPERAFEDQAVLQQGIRVGLVSKRLAACLLMTDFPNPIFSDRRSSLLRHVPATATISNGTSTFSEEMANAILEAADSSPNGSPEREFTDLWNVGEDFKETFDGLLRRYYEAVSGRLLSQEGFDDYFRLAESRRQRVRGMPIFENPLLFAATNIAPATRTMQRDGSVI